MQMTTIIVGEEVQICLSPLTEQTQLRGPDGALLGLFLPMSDATARAYEEARTRFDLDEIHRRAASEGPWLTTAEVLARLKSLESAQ
jgi:hypothetical protein